MSYGDDFWRGGGAVNGVDETGERGGPLEFWGGLARGEAGWPLALKGDLLAGAGACERIGGGACACGDGGGTVL